MISHSALAQQLRATVRKDPIAWAAACGIQLRPYQIQIAQAVKDSILHRKGLTFVAVLPRQSGKNELQRHLFAWLMFRAAPVGGYIVSVSPTFKPQTINAMDRLRVTLEGNLATRGKWRPASGFIFRYGRSRLQFFSGDPAAKVVGATADLLLSVDEAQDIQPAKFDKDFDPMTASTDATRIFWGTAWTGQTLLARQMRIAQAEQDRDGLQRLFFYTADDIRALVPAYGRHVDRVVAEKGRQHPLVKTQYFCEQIDAQSGMFNAARRALMQGDRHVQQEPAADHLYAFGIDVAGQDEAVFELAGLGNPGRDSTALTIFEIDLSGLATLQSPTYRVVLRKAWTAANHLAVFGQLKALAEAWKPRHIVIDATGVGEGLWAMLDKAFPTRVIPVKFSRQTKSEMGYGFLAIIETGRFRDCSRPPLPAGEGPGVRADIIDLQYAHCQSEILPGPQHTMRWGVPDGTRGPDGQLVHDDHIIADAMTAELDKLDWSLGPKAEIIHPRDPLEEMSRIR